MGLSNQQFEAINYLFDDRFTEFEVAERLGISERTLRRWRQNPEFKAMLDGARTELFHRNRERLLASNQGRIDNKFERHRILTERLHLVLSTSNVLSLEHTRIISTLYRDLSRLEREIAKELGQDQNVQIEDKKLLPVDLTCLNNDESEVLQHLENKIAAANPHIVTIFNRDLTERNIARCKQLVDTIQAQRLKDHPAPIPPDKFGQLTELDNKILSGEF